MTVAKVMSRRSTCARRMVGCVITSHNNQILSTGYNGVPTKWEHCTKVACPGAKFASGQGLNSCVAVHAEINALVQCGNIDKAHHIYVTTAPCVSCVKALINTGIKRKVWQKLWGNICSYGDRRFPKTCPAGIVLSFLSSCLMWLPDAFCRTKRPYI